MSSFSLYKESINNLIEISMDAGKAIMDVYTTDFNVEKKEDKSPLTKADTLSHDIISRSLKKLTPNIPVLSEESINVSTYERTGWNEYWLVDPLDGTKEFINKNGEFTTNIAFIRENRPIFGIIFAPALNQIYWGSEHNGSFMLDTKDLSSIMEINALKSVGPSICIATSRSHPSKELNNFVKGIARHKVRKIGSSLKFCLIAKGEVDCYPRFGPTSEWDTAAGEIIAKSSGAIVADLEGKSLIYNKRDGFLNPNFI